MEGNIQVCLYNVRMDEQNIIDKLDELIRKAWIEERR